MLPRSWTVLFFALWILKKYNILRSISLINRDKQEEKSRRPDDCQNPQGRSSRKKEEKPKISSPHVKLLRNQAKLSSRTDLFFLVPKIFYSTPGFITIVNNLFTCSGEFHIVTNHFFLLEVIDSLTMKQTFYFRQKFQTRNNAHIPRRVEVIGGSNDGVFTTASIDWQGRWCSFWASKSVKDRWKSLSDTCQPGIEE